VIHCAACLTISPLIAVLQRRVRLARTEHVGISAHYDQSIIFILSPVCQPAPPLETHLKKVLWCGIKVVIGQDEKSTKKTHGSPPFSKPVDQVGSGATPASVPIQRRAFGVMQVLLFCGPPLTTQPLKAIAVGCSLASMARILGSSGPSKPPSNLPPVHSCPSAGPPAVVAHADSYGCSRWGAPDFCEVSFVAVGGPQLGRSGGILNFRDRNRRGIGKFQPKRTSVSCCSSSCCNSSGEP
jgi:hypothetical protein